MRKVEAVAFVVNRGHTIKVLVLSIAFVICAAAVQAQQVTSIDVTEYGLYTLNVTSKQQQATGVSHNTVSDVRHAATTRTVPAQIGVRFGFRYRVNGNPQGQRVELKKVTIFPAPGLKSPKSAQPLQKSEYTIVRQTGAVSYTGYGLEDAWEVVPGKWTIQIWQDNRKLTEQVFNVVKQ